jgi:hypothetical protein
VSKNYRLLHDKYNCTIAHPQLYGSWEDSFQLLFSWKKAVLEKMSDSVIEIELHVEERKLYFRRFFCAFVPCLEGFCE